VIEYIYGIVSLFFKEPFEALGYDKMAVSTCESFIHYNIIVWWKIEWIIEKY
jgi:hypothetical protein